MAFFCPFLRLLWCYTFRAHLLQFEFSKNNIASCVESFKTSKVYKKLVASNTLAFLDDKPLDMLLLLAATMDKQLDEDLSMVTEDTQKFVEDLFKSNKYSGVEVLNAYSIMACALKKSLECAIQMLYEAILGNNLVVFSNDNIIEIKSHTSNAVYEEYTVLCNDIIHKIGGNTLGSLALINCEPNSNYTIKEFGIIVASTISLVSEFGSSSRVKMITVDQDLNFIHCLTDSILESDLIKKSIGFVRPDQ